MSEESAAPVETPAAPVESPAPVLTPEQQEAADAQAIEEQAIPLPDGTDKLVPLAAVTTLREKLKDARAENATLKTGSAAAEANAARIAELEAALADLRPRAEAYDAFARSNQQPDPAAQAAQDAADRAELEEIARDELYYDNQGNLDLARAERHRGRIRKEAERIAEARVGPMQQQNVQNQSRVMLANAKLTKTQEGLAPDPAILDELWGRVDPSVTATKAGAIQVWNSALGMTAALGKLKVSAPARDPLPTPLLIEKSGGRDPVAPPQASDADRRAARDLGMSVADYLKAAEEIPAGWGKSQR